MKKNIGEVKDYWTLCRDAHAKQDRILVQVLTFNYRSTATQVSVSETGIFRNSQEDMKIQLKT